MAIDRTLDEPPMSSSTVQTQPADGNALEVSRAARPSTGKKIWIDLDNSPHVPFSCPSLRDLKEKDIKYS